MFSNQDVRNDYTGNGSVVNFAFTYPVYDDDDVLVLADGVIQVKGTHYNVRNAGDTLPFSSLTASQLPADGIIKFVTAPASGVKIALLPLQAVQQSSDYVVEPFPADRVERDFDKVVMLVRVLTEKMRRVLKFATKSLKLDADGAVDDPVAGKFLRAKDPGPGLDWATPTNAGALSSPVAIADGGTGATTAAGARTNLDVPSNAEAILDTLMDAKGDLIVATASDTPARVAVGANGRALVAASGESVGVKWHFPTAPSFRAHRTANQTITTGTTTKIQFNVEGWDTDSWYDAVTNFRFTPQIAGKYQVSAILRFTDLVATNVFFMTIRKNDASDEAAYEIAAPAAIVMGNLSVPVTFNGTTDYVTIEIFHNKGSNATLEGTTSRCVFAATLISAD